MDYKQQKEMPSLFLKLSEPYSHNLYIRKNKFNRTSAEIKKQREKIRVILNSTDQRGLSHETLFNLKKILSTAVYLKIANETQWLLLNEIIEAFFTSHQDSITLKTINLDQSNAWSKALAEAKLSLELQEEDKRKFSINNREAAVAQALKEFQDSGYKFEFDGFGFRLTENSYKKTCDRIENKIKRAGGKNTVSEMLNYMQNNKQILDGSLIHARTPQSLPSKRKGGIPWHYIYNLALKNISNKPKVTNGNIDLKNLFKFSQSFTEIMNVEPYSLYENINMYSDNLFQIIHDTIIYDELFAIPQWQPIASKFLISNWIESLEAQGLEFPLFSKSIWNELCGKLISLSRSDDFVEIQAIHLSSDTVTIELAYSFLEAVSLPASKVNQGYKSLQDNNNRNSFLFPIFKINPSTFLLQPKAIIGRALCERLFTLVRENKIKDHENKMGFALEDLTFRLLKNFGEEPSFDLYEGKYSVDSNTCLDMDIVVETPERIFLFECTKKSLTRAARRGDMNAVLKDLEGSFFKTLQQLARHEERLKKDGFIKLKNGQQINWNGRHIEKIALSLFDHGSIQGRDFIHPLMRLLPNITFKSDFTENKKTIDKINKRVVNYRNSIKNIIGDDEITAENHLHDFEMSTWWLSIDQLYYACYLGGGLWQGLERIRHISRRSGDFIWEMKLAQNLSPNGRTMLTHSQKINSKLVT
jgi:hypothetical protein